MSPDRFHQLGEKYSRLQIAVVGDFCLDRYFEIDPGKQEISIETGLPVHNVVNVRTQPGGAGTILNNLVALGVGAIYPVGFAGEDLEGYDLCRALNTRRGVRPGFFFRTAMRRTFCYTKPILVEPGKPPGELNRLDFKNWSPTPHVLEGWLIDSVQKLGEKVNAMIVLDQVDVAGTGVVTTRVLEAIKSITLSRPDLLILADSRRGLRNFPAVCFKMNSAELNALTDAKTDASVEGMKEAALALSQKLNRYVFVTLSERGILGASPDGGVEHVPALPVRGPIDIVGAGDAVTANLTAALAAGATLREAMEIAMAAASIVVHQLGTTGTATAADLRALLEAT